MIKFIQKQYSEYDAMRSLYVELKRYSDKNKFEVISPSELIPVLKGNNVVVERFVIYHPSFGRDRYRMYLKIGAKAKLPDDVRLTTSNVYDKKLLDLSLNIKGNPIKGGVEGDLLRSSLGGGRIDTNIKTPYLSLSKEVTELLGEALSYNKKDRSLVLEFKDIPNAIRALNILPFGISYKIYLLDA